MKLAMIVGLMTLAAATAGPGKAEDVETTGYVVTVYLLDHPIADAYLLFRAKFMASKAYEGIGVCLRWENGSPRPKADRSLRPDSEVVVRLATKAPKGLPSAVLAEAFPFAASGVRVTVFLDRVMQSVEGDRDFAPAMLGHVLAHELGHILQGIARHSDEGLMKLRLTDADRHPMRGNRLLPFTQYDIDLIHLALGQGNCGTPSTTLPAAAPAPPGAAR